MEELTRQKLQCSTADTRTKVGLGVMDVSQFKLPGPIAKDVSGRETKRSTMESCSSHSQGEQCQVDEELACIKKELERDREIHLQIRKEAMKHDSHDLFEAYDSFTESFRKFHQGSSVLTDRTSLEELFAKLRGELKAALYDELVNQAHRDDSSSSSFLGGNHHDMLVQLQTIQSLRQHIDYLEGQLIDQPLVRLIEPKQKQNISNQNYMCSVKRSVMVENLHSRCYDTFDKDNCQSFAEYGSSAFNYYSGDDNQPVEKWNAGAKFVRQFEIKLLPQQKPFHIAESTKKSFRNVLATYKRLFRMYLESLTTSWKLLLKLVSTVKKSSHEKFVASGRTLLSQIKEQLNRVTTWYSNIHIPIVGFSCSQLDHFTGICGKGLTELHQSRQQIDGLLWELVHYR